MRRFMTTLGMLAIGLIVLSTTGCEEPTERAHRMMAPELGPDHLVVPADDPSAADPPKEPASFAWAVDPESEVDPEPTRFVARSRGYWMRVGQDELVQGIELPTTTPGATVALHPLGATGGLSPVALTVVDPAGSEHVQGEAMAMVADAEDMAGNGLPLAKGTSMFAMDAALGSGTFALRADGDAMQGVAADAFLVQVHEPDSDATLEVWTDRDAYLHGDTLTLEADFAWDGAKLDDGRLDARIVTPTGEGWAVELAPVGGEGSGHFMGTMSLDSDVPSHGAPWEVEVCALVVTDAGRRARRCAHTSFAYAVPTAMLVGADVDRDETEIVATLELEVAAPGRYAASGTVFGSDAQGRKRPVGVLQSAAWLEVGVGALTLSVDPSVLADAGLGAPFSLDDLRVVDQGRLGILHRQSNGIVLVP